MGTALDEEAEGGGRACSQPTPRHGKRNADALADAQRALKEFPRCEREDRSAKHRRAVEKVATLHRAVRRQRTDHAHKTALALVRTYDVIAHERLSITNMVRAPKPKPDPDNAGAFLPNGAAAKAGLNRSVLASTWQSVAPCDPALALPRGAGDRGGSHAHPLRQRAPPGPLAVLGVREASAVAVGILFPAWWPLTAP